VDPNSPGSVAADMRGSRALSEVFEPGSTAKVITMAAALEEGAVEPGTRFSVPDRYSTPNGQSFRDSHGHPVEPLTTAGILAESSNTGTVMVGERLDRQTRHEYLTRFGLGEPTGLDFPGETRGILAGPDEWDGRQQYTVLFGQGVSVNALQSAQVFATIANDGVRMAPQLIDAETDASGQWQSRPPSTGTPVVSPQTAQEVRTMLESAVTEGTGLNAAIPGYRVAGKTGTAQAPAPGGGYSGYTSSFIGMAPAEDPKIVVAVTVQRPQNGYYGGTAAAPVFRDVMSFALQELAIPPSGEPPTLYPLNY
jgi:cell division protein FtsI (penicillin-binding protein 3)